jgi:hypothetical protein
LNEVIVEQWGNYIKSGEFKMTPSANLACKASKENVLNTFDFVDKA